MVDWYHSEQARLALSTARTLAPEQHHRALGPLHLLAAILRQWNDERAGGPALLRACGLTAEQATDLIAKLLHVYDPPEAAPTGEPRPGPALRFVLAQAFRIAAETRAPYVGTEHLVVAMLWSDDARELRRQGITYTQAAEQLATLPHTEQAVDGEAIKPLEAVAIPTPAAAGLAELARQQAEQHSIDGRVSTLHYLLALLMHGGADKLLGELGVSYNAVRERVAADGARLVEADDHRPDEGPLEGWERFDITPQQWEVLHPRVKVVLVDEGLWQQGVRFGFNLNEERTRYWVIIHPGDSGLPTGRCWTASWAVAHDEARHPPAEPLALVGGVPEVEPEPHPRVGAFVGRGGEAVEGPGRHAGWGGRRVHGEPGVVAEVPRRISMLLPQTAECAET